MAQMMSVRLTRGDAPNWGFRLQGGKDFGTPLVVQKVNGGSPAERAGLLAGDSVIKINNTEVFNLRHKDAQDVIIRAGPSFEITVHRGGSTWRPAVAPVGSYPQQSPSINNVQPVTKTSLAAKNQSNIGAIGTGHNISAKPFNSFNGTSNGTGPRLVNKQYNTPVGIYSDQSIAETISAQSEVLSGGCLGVNFKKNEKNYDAEKSAVYRMLQEAETDPRDETEPDSGVVTSPNRGIAGLRHVAAPENKPQQPKPQLPPGQNICADCERLIVHALGGERRTPKQRTITEQHIHNNSSNKDMTICTDCQRVIVGVFVRIKDKNLHVECFKCATCGSSLKNVGYYNINNKLYCDVHAKLAAKNNAPGSNLVPITVPPGGRVPAGTISAALSGHTLPPQTPLSPSANPVAAPFSPSANLSGPRPFSSVSAPLSPPIYKPAAAPLSPQAPISAPGRFSSIKPASAPFRESCDVAGITKDVINININQITNGDVNESVELATNRDIVELAPVEPSSLTYINKKIPEKKISTLVIDVVNGIDNLPTIKVTEKQLAVLGLHNEGDNKVCNKCNVKMERGPFITALGKIWCPDHFVCATQSCRRPLQDLGFVEEHGQLYCEYCFEQYLAPNCAKCNQKIKGDCLKAIGQNFHPDCFKCIYCGKLFGNSPFFLEEGAPYCENDWNELFTTKCYACGFPVEAGDRWVEALNNNYHSQCFNCTMCKKNLEGQSFVAKGGRPYCKNHAR